MKSLVLPCLLLSLATLPAFAQQAKADKAASASSAPPKIERVDDTDTPLTAQRPAPTTQLRERRENGQVKEVEVKAGPSTYTVKPNTAAGNAVPGDANSGAARAPQWKVMEFDLNKRKPKDDDAKAADAKADKDAKPAQK